MQNIYTSQQSPANIVSPKPFHQCLASLQSHGDDNTNGSNHQATDLVSRGSTSEGGWLDRIDSSSISYTSHISYTFWRLGGYARHDGWGWGCCVDDGQSVGIGLISDLG